LSRGDAAFSCGMAIHSTVADSFRGNALDDHLRTMNQYGAGLSSVPPAFFALPLNSKRSKLSAIVSGSKERSCAISEERTAGSPAPVVGRDPVHRLRFPSASSTRLSMSAKNAFSRSGEYSSGTSTRFARRSGSKTTPPCGPGKFSFSRTSCTIFGKCLIRWLRRPAASSKSKSRSTMLRTFQPSEILQSLRWSLTVPSRLEYPICSRRLR